jgi:predicted transcriptional regulator
MANYKELLEMSGLTSAEIAEIRLNTQIIGEILKARNGAGITQQELEEISGIKQPLISRIEQGKVDPQITTILRILEPLGKTLAVVSK